MPASEETKRRRLRALLWTLALAAGTALLLQSPPWEIRKDEKVVTTPGPAEFDRPVAARSVEAIEEKPAAPEETSEPEPPIDHPALRRLEELNRYAESSRRIDEDSFDLLTPNARYEGWQNLPGGEAGSPVFSVLFTADRYALRGPETAALRVSLQRDGVETPFRTFSLEATPVASGLDQADLETVSLEVDRDGFARVAELAPDSLWPEHVGRVLATVRFTADGLAEQSGALAFQVTPSSRIPARFDGRFSDRIQEGDLAVDVGVEVEVAGLYRIEGNLFDGEGAPVAWARYQGSLPAGRSLAPIVFDGLILNDAGSRPPFRLRNLRGYRMRPGDFPHKEDMADWSAPHTLQGHYVLSDFRDEPRVNPRAERMAARLRDALARGVRLGEPSPIAPNSIQ